MKHRLRKRPECHSCHRGGTQRQRHSCNEPLHGRLHPKNPRSDRVAVQKQRASVTRCVTILPHSDWRNEILSVRTRQRAPIAIALHFPLAEQRYSRVPSCLARGWRFAMRRRVLAAVLFGVLALSGCAPRIELPSGKLVDLTHSFDEQTIYWPTEKGFELERGLGWRHRKRVLLHGQPFLLCRAWRHPH